MNEEKIDEDIIVEPEMSEEDIRIDRQLAVMCHIMGLVTGIITPLIYCLTKKDDAVFLQHHEKEALNFQITLIIYLAIGIWLDFYVFEGLYIIPIVVISDLTLSITAAFKANEGIFYKYPLSIPFLKRKKTATE